MNRKADIPEGAPAESAPNPAQSPVTDVSFERQAIAALRGLQVAMLELIGSIASGAAGPGNGSLRRPTDLQRALGVHSKLAWQVHRFAHAGHPLAEANNLPGPAAIRRLLDAAKRRGAPQRALDAVRDAESSLDELIRVHAGDRGAFDSMIGDLTDGGPASDQLDLQHRRNAFRAGSHILGVQAKALFCCYAVKPNPDDASLLDVFSVRGLLDLRRLRTSVSCMVSSTRVVDGEGNIRSGMELLDDGDPSSNPAGMIRRFCSRPMPRFCTVTAPDGYVNVDLESEAVGNLSAVTCVDGYVWRGAVARWRDEHNQRGNFTCTVRNPLEVAIVDALVHESCYPPGRFSPRAMLYSDHRRADYSARDRSRDELPLRESAVYLGRGAAALRTPDVPHYVEIAEYAFDRLGWRGGEFDVYRCRVEYPFMPSSLRLQYELPAQT